MNTNPLSNNNQTDVSREMNDAFDVFFDPNLKRALRRRAASEDGYGAYDVSMQAGYADEYRSLFDFSSTCRVWTNYAGKNLSSGKR